MSDANTSLASQLQCRICTSTSNHALVIVKLCLLYQLSHGRLNLTSTAKKHLRNIGEAGGQGHSTKEWVLISEQQQLNDTGDNRQIRSLQRQIVGTQNRSLVGNISSPPTMNVPKK